MADTNSRFIKLDGVRQSMPTLDWGSILGGTSANPIDSYMANRNQTPPAVTPATGPQVNQPQPRVLNVAPVASTAPNTPTPQPNVPSYTPPASNQVPTPVAPQTETNYMDDFNRAMLDLLKKGQGMTTADLYKKRRELERASLRETSAVTPEGLRTLSYADQKAIRDAKAGVYEPELDQNAYELKKAQDSIDNFFKVFGEASKMSADFADKMVAPQSVIDNAKKIIQTDPDKMSTVLAGFNDKTKQAILGSLDYSALGSKTSKAPEVKSINGVDMQWNGSTGKWEAIAGGGSNALSESDTYRKNSMKNISDFVDTAISQVGPGTAGFGAGPLSAIGGTPAANLKSTLTTIKANIGFEALQAMRAASKTGGALGQVAVQELEALQSVLGSLSTEQSPTQLIANLKKIKEHYKNAMDAISGAGSAGSNDIQDQVQEMRELGYTDEQIQTLMQQ